MENMRNLVRAETLGFCMGVRRAVEIVYDALSPDTPKPIYTFGPIIHNPSIIADLETRKVTVLEDPEKASGTVIIRAHGVTPEVKRVLKEKAKVLIDATCPRVVSSLGKVATYAEQGYHIIIAGDKNHGEVQALEGYAGTYKVINTIEEARSIEAAGKTLIISQTTFDRNTYDQIYSILKKKYPGIIMIDSICPATERRQAALQALADKVEAILVVGGKNSANTRRLFQTAQTYCRYSWHIEDVRDIPEDVYRFDPIGITAGASTPDWVIDEVERKLKSVPYDQQEKK